MHEAVRRRARPDSGGRAVAREVGRGSGAGAQQGSGERRAAWLRGSMGVGVALEAGQRNDGRRGSARCLAAKRRAAQEQQRDKKEKDVKEKKIERKDKRKKRNQK